MKPKQIKASGNKFPYLKSAGFSIIDIVIVCAIVGILAISTLLIYAGMKQKARDSQRMSDVQSLKSAISQFYSEEARYPGPDEVAGRLTAEKYITIIPVDPLDK